MEKCITWCNDPQKCQQQNKRWSDISKVDVLRPPSRKKPHHIYAIFLQSSYAWLHHAAILKAIWGNTNIQHPAREDIPEYYYKQRDKMCKFASSHIPAESERCGTHFWFHKKKFVLFSSSLVESDGHNVP